MLMQEFPVSLKCVASVQEIADALTFGFSYYPIVNKSGAVVGSIPYNFLITLIKNRAWYSKSMSESSKRYLEMFKEEEEQNEHFYSQNDIDSLDNRTLSAQKESEAYQRQRTQMKKTLAKGSFVDEVVVKKEIANLIQKKQTFTKNAMLKDEIIKDERKTMLRIARHERRGSELDTHVQPESDLVIDWREFNTNFMSSTIAYKTVEPMVKSYKKEEIDLRPYMIHCPFTVTTTDKFQKILDIYRYMQIKTLIVVNPVTGEL